MTTSSIARKGLAWPAARLPAVKRRKRPPPEPERVLQRKTVALAEILGWKVQTTWLSIHSPSGWPDIFAARVDRKGVGRCIAIELKSERGKTSPAQEQWLATLRACGIPAYVFKPSDWAELVRVLQETT